MEMKSESDNEFCVVNPTAPPTPTILPVQKLFKSIPIASGIARLPVAQEFDNIKVPDGVVKLPIKLPTTRTFEPKDIILKRAKALEELTLQKIKDDKKSRSAPSRQDHITINNAFGVGSILNSNFCITGDGSMSTLTTAKFRDYGQNYRWQYIAPDIVDMSTQNLWVKSITLFPPAIVYPTAFINSQVMYTNGALPIYEGTSQVPFPVGSTNGIYEGFIQPDSNTLQYQPALTPPAGFIKCKLEATLIVNIPPQIYPAPLPTCTIQIVVDGVADTFTAVNQASGSVTLVATGYAQLVYNSNVQIWLSYINNGGVSSFAQILGNTLSITQIV